MRHHRAMVAATVLVLLIAGTASGAQETILIRTGDLATHAPSDTALGDFYVLEYAPPQDVTASQILRAVLEFYVDIGARDQSGYVNPSPLIEVYALTEAMEGDLDTESLLESSRVVRNAPIGQNRRIRVDITEILRYHINAPSANHGLVVGSLTGEREGVLGLKTDGIGGGIAASVTVTYRP